MKVELINENKVKITLSFEELKKRKISLTDIQQNSNIVLALIEELDLEDDFIVDDSSNFIIETSSENNSTLILTITKIEEFPDLKKYSLLDNSTKDKKIRNNITYKVSSNIYYFKSLDTILDMCTNSKHEKLFFGKNSLYKYNDSYFVIFSPYSTKNIKFLKTYVFLSEYCQKYYSLDMFSTSIKEKSKLIIENNALQTLSKF